jgi:hypothetical protein
LIAFNEASSSRSRRFWRRLSWALWMAIQNRA